MLVPFLLLAALLSPQSPQQEPVRAAAAVRVQSIPDEAVRQNQRLTPKLSLSAKSKVQSAATALAAAMNGQPAMTQAQLQNRARTLTTQAFPNLSVADVDTVVFLVMMECAQDQQSELQQAMKAAQRQAAAKQAARAAQESDQASDMNSEQQLRLQMEMDQRSNLLQAISNMLKSVSDTQTAIIGNLK